MSGLLNPTGTNSRVYLADPVMSNPRRVETAGVCVYIDRLLEFGDRYTQWVIGERTTGNGCISLS